MVISHRTVLNSIDDNISCLQVSYAIGVAEPLSVSVFDYGTGTKSQQELMKIVKENFDLRPGRIVKDLKLKNPIFQQSATYGHFEREIFTWEQPKTLKTINLVCPTFILSDGSSFS